MAVTAGAKALTRALRAGRTSVRLEDFERSGLPLGKIEQIVRENLEGLEEVERLKGSASRVEKLLGMRTALEETPTQAEPKPSRPRPGQRALTRDRVAVTEQQAAA